MKRCYEENYEINSGKHVNLKNNKSHYEIYYISNLT